VREKSSLKKGEKGAKVVTEKKGESRHLLEHTRERTANRGNWSSRRGEGGEDEVQGESHSRRSPPMGKGK